LLTVCLAPPNIFGSIVEEAVGDFQRDVAARRAVDDAAERARALAADTVRAARAPQREARVEFRKGRELEKERAWQRELLEDELAARRRENALKALARQVPYATRLDELRQVRNPDRLLDETAAFTHAVTATERHGDLRYKTTGFDDDRLFRDPRMLLAHTLHEAGLYNSAYANDVLSAMAPARATRVIT
jgi:hypothetical protein